MIVEVRPARVQYGIRPSMGLQLPMPQSCAAAPGHHFELTSNGATGDVTLFDQGRNKALV